MKANEIKENEMEMKMRVASYLLFLLCGGRRGEGEVKQRVRGTFAFIVYCCVLFGQETPKALEHRLKHCPLPL